MAALFVLDITQPFRYGLRAEFLILGVLFVALNFSFPVSFGSGILFGYLKDAVCGTHSPVNMVEFSIIVAAVQYLLRQFQRLPARIAIVCAAITAHMAFNLADIGQAYILSGVLFLAHSAAAYLLINYVLKTWISGFPAKSI